MIPHQKIPFAKLAIIVTAFNASETIIETLSSIVGAVEDLDAKILIFDDGSNEDIRIVLKEWVQFPNLYIHRSTINVGRAKALNNAIALIESEYVAIVDADDVVTKVRFKEAVDVLDSKPGIDCVGGQLRRFGTWGIAEHDSNYPTELSEIAKAISRNRNVIGHSGATFRKEWFRNLGGYRNFERCQDFDLFLRGFNDNYFISKSVFYFYRTPKKHPRFRYFINEEIWRLQVLAHQNEISFEIKSISRSQSFDLHVRLGVRFLILRIFRRI